MHVPKTAGTAVTRAVIEAWHPRVVVSGHDIHSFGPVRDFSAVAAEERSFIIDSPAGIAAGAELVAGHFYFSTLTARAPSGRLMTVLRDPRTRIVSHWLFWRTEPDEQLAKQGRWGDVVRRARRPLAEFLATREVLSQFDNVVTRMLLAPHPLIACDRAIDPRHDPDLVKAAISRLRRFDFVDVIENPGFADRLATWLRADLDLRIDKQTAPLPPHLAGALGAELTPAARRLIDRYTRLDDVLWTFVATRRLGDRAAGLREQAASLASARHASLMRGEAPAV